MILELSLLLLLVSQGCTPRCWKTFVALIDLVSLLLQKEKLYMLISSCSAVQTADECTAADRCTRAKTAVLISQESAVFHLVLSGFT